MPTVVYCKLFPLPYLEPTESSVIGIKKQTSKSNQLGCTVPSITATKEREKGELHLDAETHKAINNTDRTGEYKDMERAIHFKSTPQDH
jgi:hypothetical protein